MHARAPRPLPGAGACGRGRTAGSRRARVACCFNHGSDNLYSILDVPHTASAEEVKAAFRRLALELHPDKHHGSAARQTEATAAFLRCKLAYEVLSDTQRRSEYDGSLAAAGAGRVPAQDEAAGAHPWSPYNNSWMDAYGASSGGAAAGQPGADYYDQHAPGQAAAARDAPPPAAAAAATTAAGVSSSGLSDLGAAAGGAGGHGSTAAAQELDAVDDPFAPLLHDRRGSSGGGSGGSRQTPAVVRAALLEQHGIALEQFGSLAEALEALAERGQRDAVTGLASEDYGDLP